MPKGIHDERYRDLIQRLVAGRVASGVSQAVLANKLGKPQQFVSRYEIGDRRLDAIEYVDVARAIGLDPLQELASTIAG